MTNLKFLFYMAAITAVGLVCGSMADAGYVTKAETIKFIQEIYMSGDEPRPTEDEIALNMLYRQVDEAVWTVISLYNADSVIITVQEPLIKKWLTTKRAMVWDILDNSGYDVTIKGNKVCVSWANQTCTKPRKRVK